MSQQGRGAKATAAQRAEVKRLSVEGGSVRGIAAEVFSDERFRSRVERILRPGREPVPGAAQGRSARSPEEVEASLREFARLGQTAQLRWLYERQLEAFVARETPASARAADDVRCTSAGGSTGGAGARGVHKLSRVIESGRFAGKIE